MKKLPMVTIGRHKTGKKLKAALVKAGVGCIVPWVDLLLENSLTLSPEPQQIQLVAVDLLTDLGLTDECQFEDIIEAGKKKNLVECQLEDIFEARLDYLDQPMDEYLIAAMEPQGCYVGSPGLPKVEEEFEILLTLECLDKKPWIRTRRKGIDVVNKGLKNCWNPEHDPAFRKIIFRQS